MIEHYLISYPLPGSAYVHGYLMTDDPAATIPRCTERMIAEAEKVAGRPFLNIVLQTHLADAESWGVVRGIILANQANVKPDQWDKAKTFHFIAWIMNEAHPDSERLMELH